MELIKSPIFYMGNKYELMDELLFYFPQKEEVNTFYDIFGGSGCVSLNAPYVDIVYNEFNNNIVELLKIFKEYTGVQIEQHIKNRIKEFNLPIENNFRQNVKGDEDNRKNAKKEYNKFRSYYNEQDDKQYLDLYTLTFFSFCNLIRFNQKNQFNMPFGNRCFINDYSIYIYITCDILRKKNIEILNKDAFDLLNDIKENKGQFIYLDPPYTNTLAIYNEQRAFGGWTIKDDLKLFEELDRLNMLGIKWAMSNVLENKGIYNKHIEDWANKNQYKIIDLDKNYSSLGKGNAKSREVLIVNYQINKEQLQLEI